MQFNCKFYFQGRVFTICCDSSFLCYQRLFGTTECIFPWIQLIAKQTNKFHLLVFVNFKVEYIRNSCEPLVKIYKPTFDWNLILSKDIQDMFLQHSAVPYRSTCMGSGTRNHIAIVAQKHSNINVLECAHTAIQRLPWIKLFFFPEKRKMSLMFSGLRKLDPIQVLWY